jgi:hypothetical protein
MVVLLKTASVRVSFIQIMQIRVQNKRKNVRKCRYDGDISLCYSSLDLNVQLFRRCEGLVFDELGPCVRG